MQPDTNTLRTLLARLQGATERDDALEADLVEIFKPMLPEEFRHLRLRPASWMSVLDVIALLPDLTHEDRQAIQSAARPEGSRPPGYVLMVPLLRFLIEREGRE